MSLILGLGLLATSAGAVEFSEAMKTEALEKFGCGTPEACGVAFGEAFRGGDEARVRAFRDFGLKYGLYPKEDEAVAKDNASLAIVSKAKEINTCSDDVGCILSKVRELVSVAQSGKDKNLARAVTVLEIDKNIQATEALYTTAKKLGRAELLGLCAEGKADIDVCANIVDSAAKNEENKEVIINYLGEDKYKSVMVDSMTRLNQALEAARNNPNHELRSLVEKGVTNAEMVGYYCMKQGGVSKDDEALCLKTADIFDPKRGRQMMRQAWEQVDFYKQNDVFAKIEMIMRESGGDPNVVLPKLESVLASLTPETPLFVKGELERMIAEMKSYRGRYTPPPYPPGGRSGGPIYDVTEIECRNKGGVWNVASISYKGRSVNCYIAEIACNSLAVMPRRCEKGEIPPPPRKSEFPWQCPPFDSACIPDYDRPEDEEKVVLIIPSGDAREKRNFNKGDARIMCGNPEVFSSNPDVCYKLTGQKPIDKEICPGMPTYDPEQCKKEGGTPVKSYESKACGIYWGCEKTSRKQGPIEGVVTQEECSSKYPGAMWSVPDKVCYYYPNNCPAWTIMPSLCPAGTSRKYKSMSVRKLWECPPVDESECTEDAKPPISGRVTEAEVACLRGGGVSEVTINNFKRAGDGFVNFTDPEMAIMKANMPLIDACRICAVLTEQGSCLNTAVCSWNSSARSCGVASSVRAGDVSNITNFTCPEGFEPKIFGTTYKVNGCVKPGTNPPYIGVEIMDCGNRGYKFSPTGWPERCLAYGETNTGVGTWTEFAWNATLKTMIPSSVTTAQKDAGKLVVEEAARRLNRVVYMSDFNFDNGVPTGIREYSTASTITLPSYRGGIYGFPSFRTCMVGFEPDLEKITGDLSRGIAPVWDNLSLGGKPKLAECERQAGWYGYEGGGMGGGNCGSGLLWDGWSCLTSATCIAKGWFVNTSMNRCDQSSGGMTGTTPAGQVWEQWNSYGLTSSRRQDADPVRVARLKEACRYAPSWVSGIWMAGAGDYSSTNFGMPDENVCKNYITPPTGSGTGGGSGCSAAYSQVGCSGMAGCAWQTSTNTCTPSTGGMGSGSCGPGYYWNGNMCVVSGGGSYSGAGSSQCPSGFHWENEGICFKDGGNHDQYIRTSDPSNIITCSTPTQVMGCPGSGSGSYSGASTGSPYSSQSSCANSSNWPPGQTCAWKDYSSSSGGYCFCGTPNTSMSCDWSTQYWNMATNACRPKTECNDTTSSYYNGPECMGVRGSSSYTTTGSGMGTCPAGYHNHSDNGGYCMNDGENYSGTCYNTSGTTIITCPSSYSPSGSTGSSSCAAGQYWNGTTCVTSTTMTPDEGCKQTYGPTSSWNGSRCIGGTAPTVYTPKQSLFAQVLYAILNAIMGSAR